MKIEKKIKDNQGYTLMGKELKDLLHQFQRELLEEIEREIDILPLNPKDTFAVPISQVKRILINKLNSISTDGEER